jgi:hypothetical protein
MSIPITSKWPGDGYDPFCARCGSALNWEKCSECEGEGVVEYDHADYCNSTCDLCRGEGGWWQCLSSREFCEDSPLPGRNETERGEVDWREAGAADWNMAMVGWG